MASTGSSRDYSTEKGVKKRMKQTNTTTTTTEKKIPPHQIHPSYTLNVEHCCKETRGYNNDSHCTEKDNAKGSEAKRERLQRKGFIFFFLFFRSRQGEMKASPTAQKRVLQRRFTSVYLPRRVSFYAPRACRHRAHRDFV